MRFDIVTIFPSLFDSYLQESLIKKARSKRVIDVRVHDLRKWTEDKHQTVDDKPFGGESGMVMKAEPFIRAVEDLRAKKGKIRVVLFTPRGKRFTQKKAADFSKDDQIIMLCGRYEGVDERVASFLADETISLGSYVLMGGEIPAMVVLETVSRLIPGVVGKENFLKEKVVEDGFYEYPQYTRPKEIYIQKKRRSVPRVLLSGDHKKIKEWRRKRGKLIK